MAKFIYKMQNLLSIKEKLEEQAKNAYSQAMAVLNEEEERLKHLFDRKEEYELILRGEVSDHLNVREIIRCQEAVEIIKYQINLQKVRVNTARQQMEIARGKLNEAMQERKIQEKLKEHAFEEFKKELAMQEQKEIDELVSFTYGIKQKSEE